MPRREVGRIVRLAVWSVQTTLLVHLAYLWLPALAAVWRRIRPGAQIRTTDDRARARRVAVLIPAHDEAAVLGNLLGDLRAQTYSPIDVFVVADNCQDGTAVVAREGGAACVERTTGGAASTKHAALRELWRTARAELTAKDAVMILDADHRVPADFVATLVGCEAQVTQAAYREDLETGNALASLDGISRVVQHQLAEAGRVQLGLSAMLVGSGMLFDVEVFERLIELPTRTLVEDREWQLHLAKDGIYVHWTDATAARSEPVDSFGRLDQQRGRWLRGRWRLVRALGGPLVVAAVSRRDLNLLDKLFDQIQLPRSLVGLGLLGPVVLRSLPARLPGLWPTPLLVAMLGAFASYFGLGLWLAGAPASAYVALLRAPLFMVRMLAITSLSLFARRYEAWVPTPHRGHHD
jgi:cellulose synthase/poly-beta-1,6-N-acetylglucosamine synthase-like glycosyltransferase